MSSVSPISYSCNYANNVNNNYLKNKTQRQDATVSFKGSKETESDGSQGKSPKKTKRFFAALATILDIAGITSKKKTDKISGNTDVNKPVEKPKSVVESLNVSPEAKDFGKKLEQLRKTVYKEVGYNEYVEQEIDTYNKLAILKATELYDTNPKAAFEIASITKHSGSKSDQDVMFVVNQYLSNPEMVMEYKNKLEAHARTSRAYGVVKGVHSEWKADFSHMLPLTKALDRSKEIVDMVMAKVDKDDVMSFKSIQELTQFEKPLVEKYLNDDRVPFDYDDIIKLCALDNKYGKEIDELMYLAEKKLSEKGRRQYPYYSNKVSDLVEVYAADPKGVRELIELGGFNSKCVKYLDKPYKENKEFITRLYNDFYKKEYCDSYVQGDAFKDIARSYKKYEGLLNLLDKQGWQNMSNNDFAKNMKAIKQEEHTIDRILKESNNDLTQCGQRIANIIKAKQLPFDALYNNK